METNKIDKLQPAKPVEFSSGIDEIRRKMIASGIPWDHAAAACGLMAEYAMAAYKQGYSRGFDQGVEWGQRKKPNAQDSAQPEAGCSLFLTYCDGRPYAAYPRHLQAEVYASGFSRNNVEIVEGTFIPNKPS